MILYKSGASDLHRALHWRQIKRCTRSRLNACESAHCTSSCVTYRASTMFKTLIWEPKNSTHQVANYVCLSYWYVHCSWMRRNSMHVAPTSSGRLWRCIVRALCDSDVGPGNFWDFDFERLCETMPFFKIYNRSNVQGFRWLRGRPSPWPKFSENSLRFLDFSVRISSMASTCHYQGTVRKFCFPGHGQWVTEGSLANAIYSHMVSVSTRETLIFGLNGWTDWWEWGAQKALRFKCGS